MDKILIIEDDNALAAGLVRALSDEQTQVVSAGSLQKAKNILEQGISEQDISEQAIARQQLSDRTLLRTQQTERYQTERYQAERHQAERKQTERNQIALILLDVNLPDGNGFDFLKYMKENQIYENIPVIMLTANDMEMDIVAGLEAGADDYITKPFSLAVLRARVNNQLRRVEKMQISGQQVAECKSQLIYHQGKYLFDFDYMKFSVDEKFVELSKTEQKLLRILVNNKNITISRERLLELVWDDGNYVDENALSVAVKRLRDKLDAGESIKTVYGIGYMWATDSGCI